MGLHVVSVQLGPGPRRNVTPHFGMPLHLKTRPYTTPLSTLYRVRMWGDVYSVLRYININI